MSHNKSVVASGSARMGMLVTLKRGGGKFVYSDIQCKVTQRALFRFWTELVSRKLSDGSGSGQNQTAGMTVGGKNSSMKDHTGLRCASASMKPRITQIILSDAGRRHSTLPVTPSE